MSKEQKEFVEKREQLLSSIAVEFQILECKAGLGFIAELWQLLEEDDKQEVGVVEKFQFTEGWIEEKAKKIWLLGAGGLDYDDAEDFIRLLINEIGEANAK